MDDKDLNVMSIDGTDNDNIISSQSSQDFRISELNQNIEEEKMSKLHMENKHDKKQYRYIHFCNI